MTVAERLRRIALDLTAVAEELDTRRASPELGPAAQQSLDLARKFLADGPKPYSDCAYHIMDKRGRERASAYDHVARLVRRGLLCTDARRVNIWLPKTAADLL